MDNSTHTGESARGKPRLGEKLAFVGAASTGASHPPADAPPRTLGELKRALATALQQLKVAQRQVKTLLGTNSELQCDMKTLTHKEKQARHLAYHDGLTGLPNRGLLMDRFQQATSQAARQSKQVALLLLDVDEFKTVNDKRGHAAGDQLLQAVAERLTACVRGADTVCRYGGDEFVIMLPAIADADTAATVVTKIRHHLAAPYLIDGHEIRATASIGIAFYPEDGQTCGDLMKHADRAMYRAKAQVRGVPCQACLDLEARNQAARNGADSLGERGFLLHDSAQVKGVAGLACTETNQVVSALHASEKRERVPVGDKNGVHSPSLFEHNPLPAWIFDPETLVFLAVNDVAARLYGYTREAFLSMTIAAIHSAEDTPALLDYVRTIPQENANAGVWKHRKKDGTQIEVEVLWHELLFQGRRAILSLANDVTDRKHAETALLAHEQALRSVAEQAACAAETANYAKDAFLIALAHELRTPLNVILGWTQALQAGGAQPELQARALAAIERSARAQGTLIDDLWNIVDIGAGKLRLDVQVMHLIPAIEAAIESVRPALGAKQIALRPTLDLHADAILGDHGRLQQIVGNLLTNAIKFTPRGGQIDITLSAVGAQVEIAIADNGEGISAKFLPHVFERFTQADTSGKNRHGGLGLGLAIAHHLVELHNGQIEARSAGEGRGACFTVRLPLYCGAGAAAGEAPPLLSAVPGNSLGGGSEKLWAFEFSRWRTAAMPE